MIEFKNVSKTYNGKNKNIHALKDINLSIKKGEIFGVIGFSGAGKSSLLRCVNLLEIPTSGKVFIEGQDITSLSPKEVRQIKKKIGMVFQHFNLLNSKTIFENVSLPLKLEKANKNEINQRVLRLLDFVGLKEKADCYPDELSGGQKQRVGIARALATNPDILLCDEATSALDPQTTKSILQLLKKINKDYQITILMITHEMSVIKEICDRVAVMEDGKIIEQNSVFSIFSNPKQNTTKNFIRSVLNETIPEAIVNDIDAKQLRNVFKIIFVGHSANNPILSQVSKKFPIDVNILHGHITELQGIPFGNLIVQLIGEQNDINQAILFLNQQQITLKEVFEDVG